MASININSLGYVVNQVLMDLQQPASPYFERYLHFAIEGYREMNLMGLMPTIKVVKIPVNPATRTAKLPDDYVEFIRIGVCCNGTFINFVYNQQICLQVDSMPELCCDTSQIVNNINSLCQCYNDNNQTVDCGCNDYGGIWAWPSYLNGYWNYGIINYGIGPGNYNGGYRIDTQHRVIRFDSCVNAQTITMEYMSNGFDHMGDAVVPEGAIPALNAYIHYKRTRFSRDAMDKRDSDRFKSEFITLSDDFNHREEALTKQNYLDVFRRFQFQQVK